MFSKFTTRIWKAPDVSQGLQPINNAASTTCWPHLSPYPICLVPTDNNPLENIGKRWYTVRITLWLSAMPNLWFPEVPKPMKFNVETSASLPETLTEHDMRITARPDPDMLGDGGLPKEPREFTVPANPSPPETLMELDMMTTARPDPDTLVWWWEWCYPQWINSNRSEFKIARIKAWFCGLQVA